MKIYRYPSELAEKQLESVVNRGLDLDKAAIANVERILEDIKQHGDDALIRYINRFDAPDLTIQSLRVSDHEFESAEKDVSPEIMQSLRRAAKQIESFHRQQLRKSWIDTQRPGTVLGQLFNPVDVAGIYVPGAQGGKTPLVSSVLMGAIPAKIAGVRQVFITTPPRKDGTINPYILAAAKLVGADAVYKAGSAWGIAALAYGTQTIPKANVIAGPGNIYVTIAKKIVSGTVGIDMIAGPSEILIIADASANPEFAAADLLSQAEHDPLASAMLLTSSEELAKDVSFAIERQISKLERKEIAKTSLEKYGAIFLVSDMTAAFDLANRIAPEHLELQIEEPFEYLGQIRNAGAVFIGHYTPEPVGDYIAGPNHVLPTAGTARFSSALSVDNFIKKTSIIHYSESAFKAEASDIIRIAEIEGLDAHARSVKIRL